MGTTSFTALRRFAGFAFTLMLFGLCLNGAAAGQGTPLVTVTSAVGMSHPTGWGTIQQSAIDSSGDWLVVDYVNGSLYEFPAGGQAAVSLGGIKGLSGGYQNPAIAIDPANNLYLGANWNNCIVMFPWNSATSTWTGLNDGASTDLSPSNPTTTICTNSGKNNESEAWAQYGLSAPSGSGYPGYFQPWGIAIGINDTLLIGNQNSGNFIFSLSVNGAWSSPTAGSIANEEINTMTARPISVAQDPEGNIYFVEDYSASSYLPGVYEIPAGTAELSADTGLTRVDPNLPAVTGVITDAAGNLYISDSQVGVVEVPNPSGTPQTASAVVLSGVPGGGEVAIDWARNLMYVPTSQKQTNSEADVAQVGFGYADYGSTALNATNSAGPNVIFSFNGSFTPAQFVIQEPGVPNADFAITGGTCTTGVAYTSTQSCLENVSFTPHSVGSISAKLLIQKLVPFAASAPDASDAVTGYLATKGTVTLIVANTLSVGEVITFTDTNASDPLYALNGQNFTVLPAGLSTKQIEISAPSVANTTGTTPTPASATIGGNSYSTAATMILHGTGVGANIQATPALESTIGGSLKTPSQVAVDSAGDVYVADAGLGQVLMYAAGSGASGTPVSVGSGLTAPTGVAVDGAGDVFIADSGTGSVYEVPFGTNALSGEPSNLNTTGQVTLVSGLGTSGLQLAMDGVGHLYIADPSNARVVKLTDIGAATAANLGQAETKLTGFTAPSAVGVDENNNLFVIDGSHLFELAGGAGTPVSLLNNLSGATGVAVDPSAAVYISSAGGTVRIPSVSGTLVPADETAIASMVTNPTALALDRVGNIYLTDATAENVHMVTVNGTLTFTPFTSPTQSASLAATVTNAGNAPLTVTGYTAANPTIDTVPVTDWAAADGSCVGSSPIAIGQTCEVEITLDPGPGEQGPLTSQIGIQGNSQDTPIINAAGTGAALPSSTTALTVASSAQVVNTPVTVNVAPSSTGGTPPTPTGTVALTYQTWTVVVPGSGANAGIPTINPVTNTVTATLDTTGKATFSLAPVSAGNDAFNVEYIGDRVYGRSTQTVNVAVAKSAITGIQLPVLPDPADINLPFVTAGNGGGTVPYDGSELPWQYNFNMAVNTAAGVPTGNVTMMDSVTSCPPGTSATGIGAATCVLAGYAAAGGYSGVACPNVAGAGVLTVLNAGTTTGGAVSFPTTCLWYVPQGVTYSPVIFTHYLYPVYSGDANFLGLSGSVSTVFQSVRGPAVQITQTGNAASLTAAPTLSIQPGSSASMNLTLTSILGYGLAGANGLLNASNFPVSLSCDNLPPHTQCSFSYPNPDPNVANAVDIPCPSGANTTEIADGSAACTPGQAVVTFYTNVSAGTTTSQNNARDSAMALAGLFGFGTMGLFFRRRAFAKARMLLMVFLMVVGGALAVSITACNTTILSTQAALSTPAGTYPVTITADEVGTLCVSSPGGAGDNCIVTGSGSSTYNGQLVYGSENQVSLPFYINLTVQ
jgi:hypothetical protein